MLLSLLLAGLGFYVDDTYGVLTAAKYLPVFVLGALTSVKAWKPGPRTAAWSLGAFVLMTGVTAATPFLTKQGKQPFDHDIWGFLWMLPLLPWVAHSLTIRSSRMDRHFGNLSYPLYLIHYWVIVLAAGAFGGGTLVKLGGVVCAAVLAVAVYVLVDRPVDRWRVRLTESVPVPEKA
jgi:peptidoglycan/LPS O-acetylase OafA/YrhL